MDSQRSFYHTSFVCGELFGAADRYRLFREKILSQLLTLRAQLETLYCENNGRPAIDPVLLCGVTLLQFMEKVSDRRRKHGQIFIFDIHPTPIYETTKVKVSPQLQPLARAQSEQG